MSTENPQTQNSSFEKFPRVSMLAIVLLTIATLGFYVPYWLYTRTRLIDKLYPGKPIPSLLIALCMGGYIMLLVLVFQVPVSENAEQIMNSPEFDRLMNAAMIINMIQLAWAMLFLQRINACAGYKPNDPEYGNYFILVLAHFLIVNIYYLQYKINQINDSGQKNNPIIGLM